MSAVLLFVVSSCVIYVSVQVGCVILILDLLFSIFVVPVVGSVAVVIVLPLLSRFVVPKEVIGIGHFLR